MKPIVDQLQSKNRTGKNTTSETETNNNNDINDNPGKADDSHIPRLSDYLLEQQKAAAETERWEKDRTEESSRQQQQKQQ